MRSLNGNKEVVAPISAPMLQIVAIPVHDNDSTPGPRYSTMAPVPPLTVKIPATLRMTSNGIVQKCAFGITRRHTLGSCPSANLASQVDTDDLRALQFPRKTSHNVDSVSTADTASNHAETTSVGGVRVGTDHQTTGESIVLEDDLVNDTRAGSPEAHTVLHARILARRYRRR